MATGGPVTATPTIVSGLVYVGSQTGTVYALHEATGAQAWSYATGAAVTATGAYWASSGDGPPAYVVGNADGESGLPRRGHRQARPPDQPGRFARDWCDLRRRLGGGEPGERSRLQRQVRWGDHLGLPGHGAVVPGHPAGRGLVRRRPGRDRPGPSPCPECRSPDPPASVSHGNEQPTEQEGDNGPIRESLRERDDDTWRHPTSAFVGLLGPSRTGPAAPDGRSDADRGRGVRSAGVGGHGAAADRRARRRHRGHRRHVGYPGRNCGHGGIDDVLRRSHHRRNRWDHVRSRRGAVVHQSRQQLDRTDHHRRSA